MWGAPTAALDDSGVIDCTRLHGAVAHVAFTADGLIAATSLWDVTVRMRALDVERCALLRDVASASGLATPWD